MQVNIPAEFQAKEVTIQDFKNFTVEPPKEFRIALDIKEYYSDQIVATGIFHTEILRTPVTINVQLQRMKFMGKILENTFILYIDQHEFDRKVTSNLFLGGWGSHSYHDIGMESYRVARFFMDIIGLQPARINCCWPVTQYECSFLPGTPGYTETEFDRKAKERSALETDSYKTDCGMLYPDKTGMYFTRKR